MKTTFLIPPPLDGKLSAERIFGCNYGIYYQPNIFILYSMAVLEEAGCETCFIDCVIDGIDRKGFIDFIKRDNSDIYIFYTVFLSRETDLIARELIKEIKPSAKFIYLSTEPTSNPNIFVDRDSFVIRGEPEETIKELVLRLKQNGDLADIKGITYLKGKEKVSNSYRDIIDNLDTLPFPKRDILRRERYNNPKLSRLPFTAVLSSRGCPHRCNYCVPNSLSFAREIEHRKHRENKPPIRLRSAGNVIDEIKILYEEGYRSFSFIDDEFTISRDRVIDICHGIKDFRLEWSCLARADHLTDKEMVKSMSEAGCRYIDIGIESFKQEILDYIKKDLKIEDLYIAVDLLNKYNIEPELNILFGSSPLETKETIEYTLKKVKNLNVDYVLFSICTPFPNTEFNRIAKKEGWMIEDEYRAIDPIKESFISYPHLPKEELERIIKKAYMTFYFRPSYIIRRLIKIKSFTDFINKAKAAITILR
ncbi:MAG: B12-binding domain-containing radical SAM protein [Nitrospirota bacterium]